MIRKFTESLDRDIFEYEDVLHDLLVEFVDNGMTYTTHYNVQKEHEGNLYSVGNSERGFGKENNFDYDTTSKEQLREQGYVRAYILRFKETYEIVTADMQRGDNKRVFGIPTEKTYEFMEISREVQDKIEALGYTYLLSMRDSEYDIMIIDGKFK
jgi:hypothetical protein